MTQESTESSCAPFTSFGSFLTDRLSLAECGPDLGSMGWLRDGQGLFQVPEFERQFQIAGEGNPYFVNPTDVSSRPPSHPQIGPKEVQTPFLSFLKEEYGIDGRKLVQLAGVSTDEEAEVFAVHLRHFLDAGCFSSSPLMKQCLDNLFTNFVKKRNFHPPPLPALRPELLASATLSTVIQHIDHNHLLSPLVERFEEAGILDVSDLAFVGRNFELCQERIPVLRSLTLVSSCLLRIGIGKLPYHREEGEDRPEVQLRKLISRLAHDLEPSNKNGTVWLSALLLCRAHQDQGGSEGFAWVKNCSGYGIKQLDAIRILVYLRQGARWNQVVPELTTAPLIDWEGASMFQRGLL